eukprot:5730436-Pleurochrysis_carterae.AAC.4
MPAWTAAYDALLARVAGDCDGEAGRRYAAHIGNEVHHQSRSFAAKAPWYVARYQYPMQALFNLQRETDAKRCKEEAEDDENAQSVLSTAADGAAAANGRPPRALGCAAKETNWNCGACADRCGVDDVTARRAARRRRN